MNNRICIGSYAEPDEAGIRIAELEAETGRVRVVKEIKGLTNPSFVVPDAERGLIYAVEGTENGTVAVLDAENGEILSRISSGGSGPCHLALKADKTLLAVCNYVSGSIELVRLDGRGLPEAVADVIKKETRGQHPARQASAHMHFSAFCGDQLLACDLGSNTVFAYDVMNGKLRHERQPFQFAPGVGPRHFVMKGEYLYVITEMGGSIYVFRMTDGREIQQVPLLDDAVCREALPVIDVDAFGAAIKMTPDGNWLLASVRGSDELRLFHIEADGTLSLRCTSPSGGRIPRDAAFCGGYVIAANQIGDSICTFTFDEMTGRLQGPAAELKISRPTCIQSL